MKGNFVLLRAGDLRLVLPQADVGAARYLEAGDDAMALAASMKPLASRPSGRFVAAEFTGDNGGVAWCWDELRVLIDTELTPIAVPKALQGDGAPLQAYVEVDGELAFLCSAEGICRYALAEEA